MSNITVNQTSNASIGECMFDDGNSVKSVEILYLTIVSLIGTLGNCLVIFSIIYGRAVNKNGNIFLINLAISDLLVTAICIPSIIPNVLLGRRYFHRQTCSFLGFLLIMSIASSFANLAYIAIERYWVVVHLVSLCKSFSKKKVNAVLAANWLWAMLLASVAYSENIGLRYSCEIMICTWNSTSSPAYNNTLPVLGYWIPLTVTVFFYLKLYRSVRTHDRILRGIAHLTWYQRSVEREMRLIRTLVATIVVSLLFWLPKGFVAFIGREKVSTVVLKITSWLAVSNSSINFIIYGINPVYRKLFKKFLNRLCGNRTTDIGFSTHVNERRLSSKVYEFG